MKKLKIVGSLVLLGMVAVGVSSASSITPESFTQTYTPPGGPIQLAPGGTNSITLLWNFFAMPDWQIVVGIDSVDFSVTLGLGDPAKPSTFTLYLQDTLQDLIGPKALVNSGTPVAASGGLSGFQQTINITDATAINAFLTDGVVNTLLTRDPIGSTGSSNSFYVISQMITVNAEVTPEPATYILIGAGLAGIAMIRRRLRT